MHQIHNINDIVRQKSETAKTGRKNYTYTPAQNAARVLPSTIRCRDLLVLMVEFLADGEPGFPIQIPLFQS